MSDLGKNAGQIFLLERWQPMYYNFINKLRINCIRATYMKKIQVDTKYIRNIYSAYLFRCNKYAFHAIKSIFLPTHSFNTVH